MKVRQKHDTLNYNNKWMHAIEYTKNCFGLIVLNTYPRFMHHCGNLENIFHWNFVIDDGLCCNLTLCCEINAHMNDIIFQQNIILVCKALSYLFNSNKRTKKFYI
jgi:hypothetical protein